MLAYSANPQEKVMNTLDFGNRKVPLTPENIRILVDSILATRKIPEDDFERERFFCALSERYPWCREELLVKWLGDSNA